MKLYLLCIILLPQLDCLPDWDSQCQGGCDCTWRWGKKVENCTKAGLTNIPTEYQKEVQVLVLVYNHIVHLEENVFINQQPNIQKITIQHCRLRSVHPKAFYGLKTLIEVDLSNNQITKFGAETFRGNNNLITLNISHNPIIQLIPYQFQPLPHLKVIDLSYCSITTIHRTTFGNLGNSVKSISLRGNQLTSLQADIFHSLTNLNSLDIQENPRKCDCHLRQFRDWVWLSSLYKYDIEPPWPCKEPQHLSKKMWDIVSHQKFLCKPKINVTKSTIYSQPGHNMTLSCFITEGSDAYNEGYNARNRRGLLGNELKWVLQGRIVKSNSSPLQGNLDRIYSLPEEGGFKRWFNNLSLVNISEDDADDYTCVGGTTPTSIPAATVEPEFLGQGQGVKTAGVAEQDVSLKFNQSKISSVGNLSAYHNILVVLFGILLYGFLFL